MPLAHQPAQQTLGPTAAPAVAPAGPATAQGSGTANGVRQDQLQQAQGGQRAQGSAPAAAAWTQAPTREQVLAGGQLLQRGHQGELVSWVQAALSRLGFPVGQTSQYGPTTEALVTQFQRTYKVGQTGKVGKTTLGVLTKAIPASVSLAEFQAMSPGIDPEVARTYLPHLNASMLQANITTDARKAAYVAQLGHESDGFNTLEEYASGADYEGRGDLGNTQKGDGKRFKGRGPIQITGRANYREYGQAIGVDLIQNPEVAATPEVGFQLAAEYWKRKDLNRYADRGEFDTVTQKINGGQNGRTDRRRRWGAAKSALAKTAGQPKITVKPPKDLPAPGPAVQPATRPAPAPAPAPEEQQGPFSLDSLMTPFLAGSYAGAAAAADDFAATGPGGLRPAAQRLADAARALQAGVDALGRGEREAAKAAAHRGANLLRALRNEGHLSGQTADAAVLDAGRLWQRADKAEDPEQDAAGGGQDQGSPDPAAPSSADDLKALSAALAGGKHLREGAKGPAVSALQRLIGMRGEAVTGEFGPTTTAVVQKAQRAAGLDPDGVVGPATLGALRGKAQSATRAADLKALEAALAGGALKVGSRGDGVKALQRLLGATGDGVSGVFGSTTEALVRRFQRDRGIEVDGVVGKGTLAALKGGGSAGAGAGKSAGMYDAYRDGRYLGKIELVQLDGVLMAKAMVPHWTRLRDAAAKDGVRLQLTSGFRTMNEQKVLRQRYLNGTGNLAAAPGFSNHQHGEALDINVAPDPAYRWMFQNARRMGWHNTVPSEPWHWEYFWRR
jgi:putative chitinase